MEFLQTLHQYLQQPFNDGFAATILKSMEDIQLASFSKQSSLQFTLSSSDIEQSAFILGWSVNYNFDLAFGDVFKELTGTPLSESSADGAWEDVSK